MLNRRDKEIAINTNHPTIAKNMDMKIYPNWF